MSSVTYTFIVCRMRINASVGMSPGSIIDRLRYFEVAMCEDT